MRFSEQYDLNFLLCSTNRYNVQFAQLNTPHVIVLLPNKAHNNLVDLNIGNSFPYSISTAICRVKIIIMHWTPFFDVTLDVEIL